MKSIERRLSALEGEHDEGEIAIWADEEQDVSAAIQQMIATGEITEEDRPRCVWWANARSPGRVSHEDKLAVLAGAAKE